jgi:tetratricopeptide (TPR) repeat protein
MRSLIDKLPFIFLVFLSACSSRPFLSGSATDRDSLSESTKRELVAAALQSAKGEYKGAVDRYRKLLTDQPTNAALHFALSKAYLGLGVVDSARMYSEKSVTLNPGNKYYLRLLAGISHQTNDYSRAVELRRQLVALEPGSTEPLTDLALEYLATDQPEKALAAFKELLTLDPRNETTLGQVLLMEIKLTHYQDAIGTLTELLERGDGKEKLRITLGELYRQTRQYDLAVKTFREVVRDNPRFLPGWLGLFDAAVQSGNRPAFCQDLDLFFNTGQISLEQKIDLAEFFVARSSRESSFVEPASVMIDEIKKRYSGNSPMTFRLQVVEGELLFQAGKVKPALQLLEKAVHSKKAKKQKKLYVQAGSILALCYDKLGYSDKSIHLYKSILDLDSGNILMMNNLAYILAVQGKELPRAKKLAMKAVAAEPVNGGYLDTLGWVLFRMGKYEKARETLEKAVELEPLEAEIQDHLGIVYEKLGNTKKAIEMQKMSLKRKVK